MAGVDLGITMSSGSALAEFKVDYEHSKQLEVIFSDPFFASGHFWRMNFYPHGLMSEQLEHNGEYASIFLELLSKSSSVEAMFEICLEGNGQTYSTSIKMASAHLFCREEDDWGWRQFVSQIDMQENHLREGQIKFLCDIMVVSDNSILVPPSDIGKHFGILLDSMAGTDVSFTVSGETFHAHRAVLAARSPVFRAELLGSMAEANMSSITLHDIAPAAFRIMLRFMYTDVLPTDDELGGSTYDMIRHLLAAADRYALDRLKLMCAKKLWENVSVDTVAATLACAEMYNCLPLKKKCIDFFAAEKNFRKAVLTPGFVQLVQQFPSIINELQESSDKA